MIPLGIHLTPKSIFSVSVSIRVALGHEGHWDNKFPQLTALGSTFVWAAAHLTAFKNPSSHELRSLPEQCQEISTILWCKEEATNPKQKWYRSLDAKWRHQRTHVYFREWNEAFLQLFSNRFRCYGVSHQGLVFSVFKQINKTATCSPAFGEGTTEWHFTLLYLKASSDHCC